MKEFMNNGFFLVPRGWRRHPVFKDEKFTEREVWIWMLEEAQFAKTQVNFNGQIVTIDRGQIATSYEKLSTIWGWSKNRIRRFLTALQSGALVNTRTDTGFLVITICNYGQIQTPPNKADTQINMPIDMGPNTRTESIIKKEKEAKERKYSTPLTPQGEEPIFTEIFDSWWKVYPHKGTPKWKLRVFNCWQELSIESGGKASDVITGTKGYAKSEKVAKGYVMRPENFLRNEGWIGFVKEEKARQEAKAIADSNKAKWLAFKATQEPKTIEHFEYFIAKAYRITSCNSDITAMFVEMDIIELFAKGKFEKAWNKFQEER